MSRRKRTVPLSPAMRAVVLLMTALALAYGMYMAGDVAETATSPAAVENADFAIHFIDVGQGDAILLASGNQHMLVDAGTGKDAQAIIDYIKAQGVGADGLDLVVATHPHSDHIGGMADVLDAFAVDLFLMPEASHTTATFEKMLDAAERNGCDARYGAAGQIYQLGDARVTVLSPPEGAFEGNNLNNSSLVLAIEYQGVRMLLMGDAEGEVERAIVDAGWADFDLLKTGHHGSNTSSSQAFLDAIAPQHTVISCGVGNDYGHPHAEVLARLSGTRVWRTDLGGTITAVVEGGKLHVSSAR